MRLGADRVDTGIRTAALGEVLDTLVDVLLHEIDGDCAGVGRHPQSLRHGVDRNHTFCAEHEGAADRRTARQDRSRTLRSSRRL